MNIILKTFFLFLLLGVMTTCYKGHSGVIEGHMYFRTSNLPVVGVDLVIGEDHDGNTEFPIAQTSTDDKGHFKVYFNKHLFKSYRQFLNVKNDTLFLHQQITKSKSTVTVYL